MLDLIIVVVAAVVLLRALGARTPDAQVALAPSKPNPQLVSAVTYADRLFAEKKWLAAEKAYVSVLKLDHKNLTAYSHLGIIYTTQKNLTDAIECFEISVRLKPGAGTYQNLAMAYYENRNYVKSISSYEKAIMFEASPSRYIGLSKAFKKVSRPDRVVISLEHAYELDPSPRIKDLLAAAYMDADQPAKAHALDAPTPGRIITPDIPPASPHRRSL